MKHIVLPAAYSRAATQYCYAAPAVNVRLPDFYIGSYDGIEKN